MEFNIVNCFYLASKNSGNQAAVITGFNNSKEKKQEFARELDLPVTVFISNEYTRVPLLEFFYPQAEMPLCLHGTLAASAVLFLKNTIEKILFTTSNKYVLEVSKNAHLIQVKVEQKANPVITFDKPVICQMLNLMSESLMDDKFPFAISSVGSPKLLIPVKSKEILMNLNPNFISIENWSTANHVNGLYLYTPNTSENGFDFFGRGFNPKTGYNEDVATGVAAAALALSLKKSLIIQQGENLGIPCQIITTYIDDAHIFVGGNIYIASSDKYGSVIRKYEAIAFSH